jgi:hypothetical protein
MWGMLKEVDGEVESWTMAFPMIMTLSGAIGTTITFTIPAFKKFLKKKHRK